MSRLVEPRRKQFTLAESPLEPSAPAPRDTIKEYGERVAKYVPSEILAFYAAAVSLIASLDIRTNQLKRLWLFGLMALFFWIVTPLWLARFSKEAAIRKTNQLVGFIAFAVWAYAFPAGIFHDFKLYDPIIAGLLLMVFTVVSAFITPPSHSS